MNINLTEGKTASVLYKYTLPIFISALFQQFYNIADSAIAGRFAGEAALAAIGASYSITMIFMAIATGSGIGCTVVISQLFGAKDIKKVKTAGYTVLIFGTILSIVVTAISLLCSGIMLEAIKTPEGIFGDAKVYLNIYFLGYIFIYLYNMANGIFIAFGDSKTPLYLLIFSSISNIFLDLLFVAVWNFGVAGAAWATFIAQGVACIASLVLVVIRLRYMKDEETAEASVCNGERPKYWSAKLLGLILGVAIPSILQSSFVSVGNLLIQSLVNRCGESVIAGFSAAIKLNTLAITCFTTMTNGVSAFTAQNIGAKKFERVHEAFKAGMVIAIIVALLFLLIYGVFGEFALSLFLDADESVEAVELGKEFLRIVSMFYIAVASKIMIDGIHKGAKAMQLFVISTFADLLLRVVLSFVMFERFNMNAIMYAWVIGWVLSAIMAICFYALGIWKKAYKDDIQAI